MRQLSIHLFPTVDARLSLSWAWRLPLFGVWCYYFSPCYSLIRCVFCPWLCFLSRQRHDWLAIRCRVALQLTATLLWHFIYHHKPCARNTTSFCGSAFSFFLFKILDRISPELFVPIGMSRCELGWQVFSKAIAFTSYCYPIHMVKEEP